MKKNNIVLFGIAVLCACSVPKERQPLTGGQWGEIKNGSAEEVVRFHRQMESQSL